MFLEQQISILEWFLKDHMTLNAGVMMLKIQLCITGINCIIQLKKNIKIFYFRSNKISLGENSFKYEINKLCSLCVVNYWLQRVWNHQNFILYHLYFIFSDGDLILYCILKNMITCKNKDLQSISKNVYNSSPYNPYILMGHPNAQFWNY